MLKIPKLRRAAALHTLRVELKYMKVEIQLLTEKYIDAVVALSDVCGLSKRDAAQLSKNIGRQDYLILVSLQMDEVTGFIEAQIIADEIHLYDVAVAPDHRREGIAKALIEALARELFNVILLEVRESNLAARRLYEACGFSIDGVRKNYYQAPLEDAILMSRKLP